MDSRINFLGVPIDRLTMNETVTLISNAIKQKKHIQQTAVNAYIISMFQKDPELKESVISSDLINADGQSVVWASAFLNMPLPERVAGIDLMINLIELSHKEKFKIFFFGAKEEIVSTVVKICSEKYSPDIVAGYRNGYYTEKEEREIATQIADSQANILFVAISSPKKENFIYQNRDLLNKVNYVMGVGGSFDVFSGKVQRAPEWMQNLGIEWFFRFLQEPKRMWKRYTVDNFNFIYLVIQEKLKRKPASKVPAYS